MVILVINCGSSSLKYQLFSMAGEKVLAKGLVERIGISGSSITHTCTGKAKIKRDKPLENHKEAIGLMLEALTDREYGPLRRYEDIDAIGHRVVHGGEVFASSVKIDEKVMAAIRGNSDLAPLHNPPNIIGIEACQEILPGAAQVAVFDTAFHQTMPDYAFLYGLPYQLYTKYGIRRYGFHGTSHQYVAERAACLSQRSLKDLNMITCHLGNGASVTAIKDGKSVDTSMGFTPLEGLIMGTRSGDVDPAVVFFLMKQANMTAAEVNRILNKESGIYGISGVSSDFRDVENVAGENERAALALKAFYYQVTKYIGAYAAVMNGVDLIVFTAGLGENSKETRAEICSSLGYLGLELDPEKNNIQGQEAEISAASSRVKVYVIPTNEELMIARDTAKITGINP